MWTEDLHWAWKLRDQKWKQEKDNSSSRSIQDTQELQELYAEDLDQDDDFQALIGCNVKKEP